MSNNLTKAASKAFADISGRSAKNSKKDKQTGKIREPEVVDPPVPSQPGKPGSTSTTDFTDSKEDKNTERNTDAKQGGNKQPSEQDEKEERGTKPQSEPINQLRSKVRRPSLPLTLCKKDKGTFFHSNSDPCLSPGTTDGKPKLGDRINSYLQNNLALIERLARHLDKEYYHGVKKCWKHLAECFGVKEKKYNTFKCSSETRPTENLLNYLTTRYPVVFTIRVLKGGLTFIKRRDVIEGVLEKHQKSDERLTDGTTVGSLFASHPGMIEEMALSLDVNKPGKKNWRHLADVLGIERTKSQNFTKTIEDNPAKILLDVVETKHPKMTIEDLIKILNKRRLEVVAEVLTTCKDVTLSSLLKDLWDLNDEAADNLCNHLNHEGTATRRAWRILGYELKIEKDHLDSFSPNEGEVISPTEALVNYLGGERPELTFKDFIEALHSIDRKDVAENCFPDLEMQYKDFLEQSLSQSAGKQMKPTTSFMETTC